LKETHINIYEKQFIKLMLTFAKIIFKEKMLWLKKYLYQVKQKL
jgi:hypothetical protein